MEPPITITVAELRKLTRSLGGRHGTTKVELSQEDGYIGVELASTDERFELVTPYAGVPQVNRTEAKT